MSKVLKIAGAVAVVGAMGLGAGLFGALDGNASAASIMDGLKINPDYEKYIQDVRNGNGSNWNLIPEQYVVDVVGGGKGSDASLSEQYSLRDKYATPLKNQGGDGICWAYAMTTAVESNLKVKQGISVELSPKQLDYLMSSTKYAEYTENSFGAVSELGGGFNFALGSIGLRSQYAPALESAFFGRMQANDSVMASYSSFGQYNDYGSMLGFDAYTEAMPEASILEKADYAVTGFKHYYGKDADVVTKVKQSILENGAAYVGSYAPETEDCWDANTKTIIDRGETICGSEHGHAMSVIGWDDGHRYTDPSDNSTKTGAFLIQNSWGKSSLFEDYQMTADKIISIYENAGVLDGKTEAEIAQLRGDLTEMISNYDAEEYIYLGYDFDSSIDFGAITDVVKNDYENIYDVTDATSAITENEGVAYEWDIDGNKEISAVSFGILLPQSVDFDFDITIEGEGTNATKTVHFTAGESSQQFIELDEPLWVSDKINVTVESSKLTVPEEAKEYLQISVYANDGGIAVPDTGLFTGEAGFSKFGGVIAVAGTIAAGLTGYAVYKNRKHLFKKVGFGKKSF